ncbi:MAG: hypothetical protein JXA58_05995 [Dehalococcoidia bacterium]|nr:hypothetical protein [Dehalococcoidia bacterium]
MKALVPVIFIVGLLAMGCSPEPPALAIQTDLPVEPEPGNYLTGYWSESTPIMLMDVSVTLRPCDRDYKTHFMYPGVHIEAGDECLVVAGHIENHGDKMLEIGMFARGYDENGVWVAETLDSEGVLGSITFEIEPGETREFLLHMNPSDAMHTIRVFGGSYRDRVRAPTTPIP